VANRNILSGSAARQMTAKAGRATSLQP